MELSTKSSVEPIDDIDTLIEWLASFGRTEMEGVTRLLYTPEWLAAQKALEGKMRLLGLVPYFDEVGNLFGKLNGREKESAPIVTGSHIDTVINGGKYDGAYGILASLVAVSRLKSKYGTPKKSIEVVSLCEEEGSRFPLTFWGSGSITGRYNHSNIKDMYDSNGTSFLEAMRSSGFGQVENSTPCLKEMDCFIELHVEQGSVLEIEGKTVGIVSHIVGQRRYNVVVVGESNHAGTTPMKYRQDALSTSSELISYITRRAKEMDPTLVATVGKIMAKPNVPNVVAGEVTFSLDIRHHQEEVLDHFISDIFQYFNNLATMNNVKITTSQWMDIKPVSMDENLIKLSENIVCSKNIPAKLLVSGAGHDSQVFGTYCPTSLLFVPSQKGISHSPKEYTKTAHLEMGIDILTELIYRLAY